MFETVKLRPNQTLRGKQIALRPVCSFIRFLSTEGGGDVSWDLTPLVTCQQKLCFGFDLDEAIEEVKVNRGFSTIPEGVMVVDHTYRRATFIHGSNWDDLADQLIKSDLATEVTEDQKGFKGFKPGK